MSDLIYREQAIEKARAVADEWLADIQEGSYKKGFSMGAHVTTQTIYHDVPSAEKTGRWIPMVSHTKDGREKTQWGCSECGQVMYQFGQRFCSNCGARMEE